MSKRRRNMPATAPAIDDSPPPALKRQSRYSCEPWEPGMVPAGMIFTTRPSGLRVAPWCRERSGVETPRRRGDRPPKGD